MIEALRMVLLTLALALPLSACTDSSASLPSPQEPTAETISHFCGMFVLEHAGPKGQIFLRDRSDPIWFSSPGEAIAYTMLPDEPADIAAIYVNDMAKAKDWDQPEKGAWVEARSAWYVLGSKVSGGMGGEEPVPFSTQAAAEQFAASHGGTLARFAQIPKSAVLGGDTDSNATPETVSSLPADQIQR
jgi:copper chaperone NosL